METISSVRVTVNGQTLRLPVGAIIRVTKSGLHRLNNPDSPPVTVLEPTGIVPGRVIPLMSPEERAKAEANRARVARGECATAYTIQNVLLDKWQDGQKAPAGLRFGSLPRARTHNITKPKPRLTDKTNAPKRQIPENINELAQAFI